MSAVEKCSKQPGRGAETALSFSTQSIDCRLPHFRVEETQACVDDYDARDGRSRNPRWGEPLALNYRRISPRVPAFTGSGSAIVPGTWITQVGNHKQGFPWARQDGFYRADISIWRPQGQASLPPPPHPQHPNDVKTCS